MATTFAAHILGPDDHASRPAASTVPYGALYYCTDHDLVYINNAGTWGTYLDNSASGGAVATDAIWDAKGDLAVGTGANTAQKLTVGTNGYVLTADSTETTGVKWAASSGGGSLAAAHATRTSEDLTLNNTSWTNVDTGMDLTIPAATGDIIFATLSCVWGSEAVVGVLDAATIVSGSPVNYVGGGGGASHQGVLAWRGLDPGAHYPAAGGGVFYTIQSGDISGGNVVLRLRYRTLADSNKTLFASSNIPLKWGVVNFGH